MSFAYLLPESPENLLDYFAVVADLPYAMFLDSAAPDHVNSRYDLLVCQPLATLEAFGRQCIWHMDGSTHQAEQDPFLQLKTLQATLLPEVAADACALPFCGGALGYIGYDAGRTIEPMPDVASNDINLPDLAFGIYAWALVLDKHLKQLWYVDCRGDAKNSWLVQQQWFLQRRNLKFSLADAAQIQQSERLPLHFALRSEWQANLTQNEYFARFDQIQQYLQSGDCYQINLAQRFSATYQGDEWQAYLALRETNAAPFSAFLRLKQGVVLSISPERFLELKQRLVETKPIKGTKPRFADPLLDQQSAEALRLSPKDRAENVMIVDLLRNDLGKVCKTGSVKVPALFSIESFPAVHHLVSTIVGELADDYQAADLLKAAFPGGSITGAPKIRAMQIIEELEPCRRSVYCGAIGYISQHGHMDTNIAIRTLVCADQQIYCWAGGGIVADSNAASEYQETFDKVARILPVLAKIGISDDA
ncbi:aminodeoxychorismate synthase, component I [Rheinheimera sp. SA_1]|uniref:aminodeoxychorismate synthase component I n=1 Tax=Rheinheimera sp. SA_1 TaxID=1827365 RepID=UPI00080060DF|nr:aminodeoxychorismate synthase component I [Rheinheimera sp. SA_1]OBP14554.1 aminodeoxychorismate synthase, component I [Rheinheimera sp. SA_1]